METKEKDNQIWLIKKNSLKISQKSAAKRLNRLLFKNVGSKLKKLKKMYFTKLDKNDRTIDFKNFFFEIDDAVIKSYNFVKQVETLYDLLINLFI